MRSIYLIFITIFLMAGCSIYRVDVQQGNIIDAAARNKLHLGMSKSEVSATIGDPVLSDAFDTDKNDIWVYAYTNQINGGKIQKKNFTLEFKNNKLIKID